MSFKKLLDVATTVQSAALVGENIKFAKQKDKDVMDFAKMGVGNIVGVSLLGKQSDIIGSLK